MPQNILGEALSLDLELLLSCANEVEGELPRDDLSRSESKSFKYGGHSLTPSSSLNNPSSQQSATFHIPSLVATKHVLVLQFRSLGEPLLICQSRISCRTEIPSPPHLSSLSDYSRILLQTLAFAFLFPAPSFLPRSSESVVHETGLPRWVWLCRDPLPWTRIFAGNPSSQWRYS